MPENPAVVIVEGDLPRLRNHEVVFRDAPVILAKNRIGAEHLLAAAVVAALEATKTCRSIPTRSYIDMNQPPVSPRKGQR